MRELQKCVVRQRRCCPRPFLTHSQKWWKPEDKARSKQSYTHHSIWCKARGLWCAEKTCQEGSLQTFAVLPCDRVTWSLQVLDSTSFCLPFLHTMAAESKSSRYADRAEDFFSTTSTWTSLHVPIIICMLHTHTSYVRSCTHSSSWVVLPNTKLATFTEIHKHLYLNCKSHLLVQLCNRTTSHRNCD